MYQGWGDSSVCNVLVIRAVRTRFNLQNPSEKPGGVHLQSQHWGVRDTKSSIAWFGNKRPIRDVSKQKQTNNKGKQCLRRRDTKLPSGFYRHMYTYTHVFTRAYICTYAHITYIHNTHTQTYISTRNLTTSQGFTLFLIYNPWFKLDEHPSNLCRYRARQVCFLNCFLYCIHISHSVLSNQGSHNAAADLLKHWHKHRNGDGPRESIGCVPKHLKVTTAAVGTCRVHCLDITF